MKKVPCLVTIFVSRGTKKQTVSVISLKYQGKVVVSHHILTVNHLYWCYVTDVTVLHVAVSNLKPHTYHTLLLI